MTNHYPDQGFLHRLAHRFGWVGGEISTITSADGMYTSLRCRRCGQYMRICRVPESLTRDIEERA